MLRDFYDFDFTCEMYPFNGYRTLNLELFGQWFCFLFFFGDSVRMTCYRLPGSEFYGNYYMI